MADIPQKRDFLSWSIQNIVIKAKQFVRNYYITWLIHWANKQDNMDKLLTSFYAIVLLKMVLFCQKVM